MKKIILVLIFIGFFVCFSHTNAEYDNKVVPLPSYVPTISDIIAFNASKYGIETSVLYSVIECESGFKTDAHNKTSHENSWGLVQINLASGNHKNITVKEATDPDFAISYLAKNLKNNTDHWSCFRG